MLDRFDGERLRAVMRGVASPVTVVTFRDEEGPRGITIGSFASVSLDPPLISFNVSGESSAHDALTAAVRLNVNILASRQAHLASHFALSGFSSEEQFAPVAKSEDEHGVVVLDGALATLFCHRVASHAAGDSTIIVARVDGSTMPIDASPLLYFQQHYHAVGEDVGQLEDETNRLSSSTP